MFVIIQRLHYNFNLILVNDNYKEKLVNMLGLEYHDSFKPINMKYNSYDIKCYELKYLISKEEYNKNNLKYSQEEYVTITIDFKYVYSINDDTYMCIVGRSNIYNDKDFQVLDEIRTNYVILESNIFELSYIIINIFLYGIFFKKKRYYYVKSVLVYLILFSLLIISNNYDTKEVTKNNNEDKNDTVKNEIIEENKDICYSDKLNMRIMLADILNYDNQILITEGNVDNTLDIIKRANLKPGIYVAKDSLENIQNILNIVFGENIYLIDKNSGYIQKQSEEKSNNLLNKNMDNIIAGNEKVYVLEFSNIYKNMLETGEMLEFMIDDKKSSEVFKYNEYIDIVLINPEIINFDDELSIKENCEEIIANIFNN